MQRGYKDDWIGYIMVAYMAVISIFWIITLLILSLDYYGYVRIPLLILLVTNIKSIG